MSSASADRPGSSAPLAPPAPEAAWGAWLAWTWVLLLLLCTIAEVGGLEDLRLALDLQRHF